MALTGAHTWILVAAAVALFSAYTMGLFSRNRMPMEGKVRAQQGGLGDVPADAR